MQEQQLQQQEQAASSQTTMRQPDVWNKDVGETGRWGTRSRKELLIVTAISVVLIAVTLTGVLVGTRDARQSQNGADPNNNNGKSTIDPDTGLRVSTYTLPPPPALTPVTDQEEWDLVRATLASTPVLALVATSLPASVADLTGLADDASAPAILRAASWLTTVDTMNARETAVPRFALAAIYYETGGASWTNQTNWLKPASAHCDWYGVACCESVPSSTVCNLVADSYNIVEIDLYQNNLVGPIPPALALIPSLQSLFLSENALTGTINGDIFASLPVFSRLYLQHNLLTGEIPLNLDTNQKLGA